MSRIVVVILVVVCWIEFTSSLGGRPFSVVPDSLTADCNPTQRRARLLCPCLLTPSTNNGVPIPCLVTGSFCLPYSPLLASIGIAAPKKGGLCQCGVGFTRNAVSNTCIRNTITISPSALVVSCGVLVGDNVARITINGGIAPFVTSISVVSTGFFPGDQDPSALPYLMLDPNDKLSIVAAEAAPDFDITQCYRVTVTDAAGGVAVTTFCALIETPFAVCPRPIRGSLSPQPIVVGPNAKTGDVVGKLAGSGGTGPYTFTALTVVSCSDSRADRNGCNNFLTLDPSGTLVVPSGPTPAAQNSPVTQCYTATVKDFLLSEGSVDVFCAQVFTPA